MNPTSVSLLERLRIAQPDASDWNRLQEVYRPLIRRWIGRVPGLGEDAEDLTQEVFLILVRQLPRFERKRDGSFRAWLRQVAINKVRMHRRRRLPVTGLDETDHFLDQLADPHGELAHEWDREHDKHVTQKLMAAVSQDFSAMTWKAFQRFAMDGLPAAEVARELGMTENAVIRAKSRVLNRLREEAGEFLG